jgi:polyribonucleotide nucleotidyltransferase
MIGAACALEISDIPFNGPTAAVAVGWVDGDIVINPTVEQRKKSKLTATVAGTLEKITMIEAGADEIPNEKMLEAIKTAHNEIKNICNFISEIKAEIGKPKFEYQSFAVEKDFYEDIVANFKDRMYQDVQATDKEVRDANIDKITEDINSYVAEKYGEEAVEERKMEIADSIHDLEKACVREMILEEHKRPDGRKIDEIRPLSCEVGVLPRVHGSAIFTRGQTQVMSIVTLGMKSEEQMLDGIDEETEKRYMHQYNFPSYSVGEARPSRGPGRREIGHGALAEKALVPVIPSEEEFPYAIRVVSEVLSSNGSTSQASICGSTLALMDAGVPIKKPVAGISTGLVTDKNDPSRYIMLTDIQGIEDFFGDMDFKVGGTKDGITAIQVDIKIDGLTYDIIKEAFERTKVARDYILDNIMLPVIDKPRADISKYAPRILTTKINPEKIKDVIGTGGKTINKIIDETGVKIDIEDDGQVCIYSNDMESAQKAMKMIEIITRDIEAGKIYDGVVTKIMSFGAFVDLGGGKEGLLHISKISNKRVDKVEDVLAVGDEITVKVTDIDNQGRINLSMKELEAGHREDKE